MRRIAIRSSSCFQMKRPWRRPSNSYFWLQSASITVWWTIQRTFLQKSLGWTTASQCVLETTSNICRLLLFITVLISIDAKPTVADGSSSRKQQLVFRYVLPALQNSKTGMELERIALLSINSSRHQRCNTNEHCEIPFHCLRGICTGPFSLPGAECGHLNAPPCYGGLLCIRGLCGGKICTSACPRCVIAETRDGRVFGSWCDGVRYEGARCSADAQCVFDHVCADYICRCRLDNCPHKWDVCLEGVCRRVHGRIGHKCSGRNTQCNHWEKCILGIGRCVRVPAHRNKKKRLRMTKQTKSAQLDLLLVCTFLAAFFICVFLLLWHVMK